MYIVIKQVQVTISYKVKYSSSTKNRWKDHYLSTQEKSDLGNLYYNDPYKNLDTKRPVYVSKENPYVSSSYWPILSYACKSKGVTNTVKSGGGHYRLSRSTKYRRDPEPWMLLQKSWNR